MNENSAIISCFMDGQLFCQSTLNMGRTEREILKRSVRKVVREMNGDSCHNIASFSTNRSTSYFIRKH